MKTILTAWKKGRARGINDAYMQELKSQIEKRSYKAEPVIANWNGEDMPSFEVKGLPLALAYYLAKNYGQTSFVYCDGQVYDATPGVSQKES